MRHKKHAESLLRYHSHMSVPERVDVIGSRISACGLEMALTALSARLAEGSGGYVCFTNVHATVEGQRDREFRAITNASFLSMADGKPVYWAGRAKGARAIGHAPGPDFLLAALRRFPQRRHFFFGSTAAVVQQLVEKLRGLVPGLQVCGVLSPPFRPLSDAEKQQHYAIIRNSGAEFVWVGLGAPKQEQWMRDAAAALKPAVLFGVGAAFDFHSGNLRRAPEFMGRLGLEWLYRLSQEPRRLWRRYLVTNSLFLAYLARDFIFGRNDSNS